MSGFEITAHLASRLSQFPLHANIKTSVFNDDSGMPQDKQKVP